MNYNNTNVYNTGSGYNGMTWEERQKMINDQAAINRGVAQKIQQAEDDEREWEAYRVINGCIVSINPKMAGRYLSKYKLVFNDITSKGYRDVWVVKDTDRNIGNAFKNNCLLQLIDDPKIVIAAAPEDLVIIEDPTYTYDKVSILKHLATGAGIAGLIGYFAGGKTAEVSIASALMGAAAGTMVGAIRNENRRENARNMKHLELKMPAELRRHLYEQIKLYSASTVENIGGKILKYGAVAGAGYLGYKAFCRSVDKCTSEQQLEKLYLKAVGRNMALGTAGTAKALGANNGQAFLGGVVAGVGSKKAQLGLPESYKEADSLDEKKKIIKRAAKKFFIGSAAGVGAMLAKGDYDDYKHPAKKQKGLLEDLSYKNLKKRFGK